MAGAERAQRAAAFVVPPEAESVDDAWDRAQAAPGDEADSGHGKRKRPRRISSSRGSSSGSGSRSRPSAAQGVAWAALPEVAALQADYTDAHLDRGTTSDRGTPRLWHTSIAAHLDHSTPRLWHTLVVAHLDRSTP